MAELPFRRLLVTGGAGFIGTHLVERLAGQAEVVLFDNLRRNSLAYVPHLAEHPGVRVLAGDVLDPEAVDAALEGVDAVVHLAAIAGVSSYYQEPLRTLQVNLLGTVSLLERCAARGVGHFVHVSTSEIFGADALWVDEDANVSIGPLADSRWVYAISKLSSEQMVMHYAAKHGFRHTILRPFNVYGPRQTGEGAISNFLTALVEDRPLTVYNDGSPIRAWCYVSDFVDATVAALTVPAAAGEAFNIGNAREVETTLGLARRVAALREGGRIEFEVKERREVRSRVPVIGKARRLLGFEPRVDLDEGLRSTLDWFTSTRAGAS